VLANKLEIKTANMEFIRNGKLALSQSSALEATQGQNDSFFSQLPYKCYLEEVAFEVASVGD